MNTMKAWLLASRPASQSYIFFPLLLGQAVHYNRTGKFDWVVFVLLHLYGLFLQLFIVYANDRADIETDRLNMTYTVFSGGSRTLVDGLISLRENYAAVLCTVVLNVLIGIIFTTVYGRDLALPLIALSLGLLWVYSFAPVRLSYRGGGELLQMLGVGASLVFIKTGVKKDAVMKITMNFGSPAVDVAGILSGAPILEVKNGIQNHIVFIRSRIQRWFLCQPGQKAVIFGQSVEIRLFIQHGV